MAFGLRRTFRGRGRRSSFRRRPYRRVTPRVVKRIARRQITNTLETKSLTVVSSGNSVDTGGTFFDLITPTPGDSITNREADRITLKSMWWCWYFTVSADTSNVIRYVLFQWKPDNNVDSPTLAKLFQDVADAPLRSPFITNVAARSKFSVMLDRFAIMTDNAQSEQLLRRKMFTRFASRRVHFNTGATSGRNKIFLLLISDSGFVPHPVVSFTMRYKWIDG